MNQKHSNKLFIIFILLVLILSIVFTWKAIDLEDKAKEQTSQSQNSFNPSAQVIMQGRVGINLLPKEAAE